MAKSSTQTIISSVFDVHIGNRLNLHFRQKWFYIVWQWSIKWSVFELRIDSNKSETFNRNFFRIINTLFFIKVKLALELGLTSIVFPRRFSVPFIIVWCLDCRTVDTYNADRWTFFKGIREFLWSKKLRWGHFTTKTLALSKILEKMLKAQFVFM